MSETTDKRKIADAYKQQLEEASFSSPDCGINRPSYRSGDRATLAIPKPFLDAILEVVALSIERALATVMTRCVDEGVERAIRPLAEELALLRVAFDHDWRTADNRRQNSAEYDKETSK